MTKDPLPSLPNAYEILIQGVVDYAIYMLDPQGRIVSWNPGAERIKGYTAAEIIGAHFSRFSIEEDRRAGLPEAALRSAAETGRFTAEAWRLRKDGSRFWAMIVIDAIRHDGVLVGFAKITRDMTEQRQAQLAMLESERRFRLLVQSVTDYAIFMLDPEGLVSNWNLGAERIKGYAASEIIGRHFSRFYTPEDVAAGLPARALAEARRQGRFEAEGWRLRRDGTRFWASVVIDVIYDDGRLIGFAKVTRDLTERRRIERELEASREQLFQAQKMDAVGQLTSGLAHDFNNLLTAVTGSLELLQLRVSQGRIGELGRYVSAAQGAAARAAGLTNRLLSFARRQTLSARPTDANRLVAGMRELIHHTVGVKVALETRLQPEPWSTLCDPNQLESAILNLCINARDAMPEGGRLVVETAHATLAQRAAADPDTRLGDYVVVSVCDTGEGMPPEVMSRVFEPFFTTKPMGHGTGLGLSMVYGFAKQSGGQVRVASTPGEGTRVSIYLPRHLGQAAPEEEAGMAAPQPGAAAGQTVLVVDDEAAVRMLVAEVLKDRGFAVLEAADAPAGLALLQSDLRIDLLVSDVGLPGAMNGRQMADAARLLRPALKVLFVTGYAEEATLRPEEAGPEMHVLAKPFSIDVLAATIERIAGPAARAPAPL